MVSGSQAERLGPTVSMDGQGSLDIRGLVYVIDGDADF
jgi:hypothetical protein